MVKGKLSKREDIIITNAEKGGAVLIVNRNDYIKEAKRQLNEKASITYYLNIQH